MAYLIHKSPDQISGTSILKCSGEFILDLPGRCLFLFLLKGKDEPMGRCTFPPVVKLNPSLGGAPKLLWFPVSKKGRSAGEVLLAAELLLNDKVKKNLSKTNTWTHL